MTVMASPLAVDQADLKKVLFRLGGDLRANYIAAYRLFVEGKTHQPCNYGSRPIPKWDGGKDGSGRNHKPVWWKLATFAFNHQIDPTVLVLATFNWYVDHGFADPPLPTVLGTPQALQRAQSYLGDSNEEVQRQLDIQNSTFRVAVSILADRYKLTTDTAACRVLRDTTLELSSLYRYCIAWKAGIEVIATSYFDLAFKQYIFRRAAYNEIWGPLITQDLRHRGEAFQRLLAKGA